MVDRDDDYMARPPGYRFYPTEEELVSFYLHNKLLGTTTGDNHELNRKMDSIIPVLDIYDFNPWDLPKHSGVECHDDKEQWFFFIPRQESEARGGKPKRLTTTGYWKATGSPGYVYSSNHRIIGLKRTMVFYRGRAPTGRKTEWKMNEYKAIIAAAGEATITSTCAAASVDPKMIRQEFSLCRVYKKSKCLRAFDRRPPAEDHALQAYHHGESSSSSTISQDQINIINPTNSIIDHGLSSFAIAGGDHHEPTGDDQISNILELMDVDCNNQDEAFWDWDWDWDCFHGMYQ